MTGQTGDDGTKNVETMVLLKYLRHFWRALEMPLINCEINLILTWSTNSVIVSTNVTNQNATFEITDTKLYVPVVTLSAKNLNLNHLVEPSFQGVNRLFVLAFENDTQRASAKGYYLPNVEIKDYNVMINGENFFFNQ